MHLGNDFTFSKKVNMFVDFMYSDEQIDRKGIITGILKEENAALDGHNALDAEYLSVVTKVNYRFQPKWNAFVKGMYETASVSKHAVTSKKVTIVPLTVTWQASSTTR